MSGGERGTRIGIDGGGTRTTVAVAVADRPPHLAAGPAGRVDPVHPERSIAAIADLVRRAATEAGAALPADSLVAGLAGVGDKAMRDWSEHALGEAGLARAVGVVSDGETALQGAFDGGAGILLIAGTGSTAHARGRDGTRLHAGGWGKDLGDEGSGFGVARAGLRAALRAVDGRGDPTELWPALGRAIELADPEQLPTWAARSSKTEVAALAPEVIRLAEAGDPVAAAVVAGEAAELALHVAALARRLGDPELPVVLHGGLGASAYYRDVLAREIQRVAPGARLGPAAGDALHGALSLANALLHIGASA